MDQLSESYTKVWRSAINLKIAIIRFCMADELNGQALPVHHTKPYKKYNFQIDGTSRCFGLRLWKLVHLLSLVCSFYWCVLSNFSRAVIPWQRPVGRVILRIHYCTSHLLYLQFTVFLVLHVYVYFFLHQICVKLDFAISWTTVYFTLEYRIELP